MVTQSAKDIIPVASSFNIYYLSFKLYTAGIISSVTETYHSSSLKTRCWCFNSYLPQGWCQCETENWSLLWPAAPKLQSLIWHFLNSLELLVVTGNNNDFWNEQTRSNKINLIGLDVRIKSYTMLDYSSCTVNGLWECKLGEPAQGLN
jgi:hypothetical protein